MVRALGLVVVVTLAACGETTRDGGGGGAATSGAVSSPTPTPTPSTFWTNVVGTTACGVVRAFTAPTASAPGSIDIGSRHYAIAAGVRPPMPGQVNVGAAQCVWGGIDAPIGPFGAGAEPIEQWRCGRVRDFAAPTSTAAGHVALLEYWSLGLLSLPIPAGVALPSAMPFDTYRCVVPEVDPASGDAVARQLSDVLADVEVHCGVVKAFTPPSATTAGAIRLGSRSIALREGTPYQRDPAGSPADPTSVGQVLCFNALLDDRGEVVRYGPHHALGQPDANGNLPGICGRAGEAFRAPSANADGYIGFSLRSTIFRIPAGAPIGTVPPCVVLHVDANGDLVAPAGKTPGPVGF